MTDKEWIGILKSVRDRWPDGLTDTDINDWQRALRHDLAGVVEEALFTVRTRYSSQVPKLAWVMRAIDEVRAKRNAEMQEVAEAIDAEQHRAALQDEAELHEREHGKRVAFLVDYEDKGAIAAALRRFTSRGWCKPPPTHDPREWSKWAVGLVWTRLAESSVESPRSGMQ